MLFIDYLLVCTGIKICDIYNFIKCKSVLVEGIGQNRGRIIHHGDARLASRPVCLVRVFLPTRSLNCFVLRHSYYILNAH